MAAFFQIKDINLGPASYSSGHEAYLSALYHSPKNTSPIKIIYKKNKHGRVDLSRLEITFSQLAQLFLSPNLTPFQNLVVDEQNHILGLAVQHLCYVIEQKEGLNLKNAVESTTSDYCTDSLRDFGDSLLHRMGDTPSAKNRQNLSKNQHINHSRDNSTACFRLKQPFYTLTDPKAGCVFSALEVKDPTKIPFYFLDKLPQGFYAQLVEAEAAGRLTIDYDSLASILATSYTLEEDDLHKGNFGFYLVEREGKPQAVFFKIDHDLMFVDSIMGFHTRRPFHLTHGVEAFDITVDDLMSLVCLKNSSNSYWPTKFGYFSNPFDNKEYHNFADIDAFARLSTNRHFIKAKWKSFYKHILIPQELIEQVLKDYVDMKKASDRAHVALMAQATAARLARLRAVLFSIKEFRDYVGELTEEEKDALFKEVIPPHLVTRLSPQVKRSFAQYKELCTLDNGFEMGDTPLHTAIKLGDYRYEETIRMFGQFLHVKNKSGKTPLDVAVERFNTPSDDLSDVRSNVCSIIQHLLQNGAKKTKHYQESGIEPFIKAYQFKNPYLEGITNGMSYPAFKAILRDIGEDHRFCLKSKKNLAIECIQRYIKTNKNHPHFESRLQHLSDDINGYSSEEECAGVKYIRQLRSRLWIIRQLRGLYGWTSTQGEINALIRQAKAELKIKEPGCFSFFHCGERPEVPRTAFELNYS